MNHENLKRVIDHITANPETWNQDTFHSYCGTKHCIAGHAQIMSGIPAPPRWTASVAANWLGITTEQAEYLFGHERTWDEILAFQQHGLPKDNENV
jgi:hypothetical protein